MIAASIAPRLQRAAVSLVPYLLVVLGSLVVAVMASSPASLRYAVFLIVGAGLLVVGLRTPRFVFAGSIIWLGCLGAVRRLLDAGSPSPQRDPLLLIGAAACGVLLVTAHREGAFRSMSKLGKAVGALTVLAFFGAVNPVQPSLVAGVSGILFVVIPLLWFWIGRALGPSLGTWLGPLVSLIALMTALYGLVQVFAGFPSWDEKWIAEQTVNSLNVGSAKRPFGLLTSAQEHASVLAAACIVLAAQIHRVRRMVWAVPVFAIAAFSLLVASVRGPLVLAVFVSALIIARRLRLRVAVAAPLAVVLLVGVLFLVQRINPEELGNQQAADLVRRSTEGFSDPLSEEDSTLTVHLESTSQAIETALVKEPLGYGLSAISIAGAVSGFAVGAENDISRAAYGFGIPGLIVFALVLARALRAVWIVMGDRRHRDLGILAAAFAFGLLGQWMNGGLYLVAPLAWFVLGWVDVTLNGPPPGRGALAVPREATR